MNSQSRILFLVFVFTPGSEFVDGLESEPDDSSLSPWWEHVRQTLAQSTSVASALSLAAVCRSVALGMSTTAKKVQVKLLVKYVIQYI